MFGLVPTAMAVQLVTDGVAAVDRQGQKAPALTGRGD